MSLPTSARQAGWRVAAAAWTGALVSQNLAQVVQLAAQVGQRLRIGGLGPEQAGDPLPGLRGPGMRDEECDQDDSAGRPGPDAAAPVVSDGLLA